MKAGCPQGSNDCLECGLPVDPDNAAFHDIVDGLSRMLHIACGDAVNRRTYRCDGCQRVVEIGDWPYCPHGKAQPSKGFEAYVDYNISDNPVTITNPGDRTKYLKPHWENDHIVHLQPRDKSASYYRELNQRREARPR